MAKAPSEYNRKRNFDLTAEPREENQGGKKKRSAGALRFVIQKHDARRLHYDFRLEMDGTLKSWAIPKGPSLDPKDKRLAVHVEDHPLSYASFEGSIPHGQYGGGDVIVWDQGVWQPHEDPETAYKTGKLKFTLIGEKLVGDWNLVRTNLRGSGDKEQWLLIKERDQAARNADEYDIVAEQPQSVVSGALVGGALVGGTVKSSAKASTKARSSKAESSKSTNSKTVSNIKDSKTVSKGKDAAAKKDIAAKKDTAAKKAPIKKSVATKATTTKKDQASFPELLSPELATLVTEPPAGKWLYEIKFDGYRILARVTDDEVRLFTRNGNDWTHRLPLQAKALKALKLDNTWLDGEVVVLNEQGLPDFQALQNAFEVGSSRRIIFYLFDVPFLNGRDLRELPVEERRAELEKLLPNRSNDLLRFSSAFDATHKSIVESACAMSLEGVIGKRAGSTYVSRRSPDWIKLKCRLRQEFVIVGFTRPQGSRTGFGALLLGVYSELGSESGPESGPESGSDSGSDSGAKGKSKTKAGKARLIYAGRVGTGFNELSLKQLHEQLRKLERDESPLAQELRGQQAKGVHWVEPRLVCEVEFAEWTGEGLLRQAAFIALRSDKPPRDIIREKPRSANALQSLVASEESQDGKGKKSASARSSSVKSTSVNSTEDEKDKTGVKKSRSKSASPSEKHRVADITVTHPDRVIDPDSGAQKQDLAQFYASIFDWILPHLKGRPVSLLRAPDGVAGEQFFQKHAERLAIPNITHLDPDLDPGHARLMEIDSIKALVGAVQMSTIELHTWGATSDRIETPDRIILDLDPDPALPWRSMIEATRLVLAVLDELKLDAYLKTSGGKGMHVVVPLARQADWSTVKDFAKAISEFMARQIPERFVAKMGPKNRVGKIFIDYLRNSRGASTVSAYSVRARPGLAVSVPIARDELQGLSGADQWNIGNLHERLEQQQADPWEGYANRQRITRAMWKRLGNN